MPAETTMRRHLAAVRMAVTNKSAKNKHWRWCGERGPPALSAETSAGAATVENSMEVP